jgi:hypothetical protein
MKMLRSILLLAAAVFLSASAAHAQYDTATVLGRVADPTGAVVPGSKLTLRNVSTGVSTVRTADSSGDFEFTSVLPAEYTLTTNAPGFKAETTTFSVAVSARQRVDIHLQPGSSEVVNVNDNVASLLETDSSDNGFTVQPREIMNLPLNGREYSDLAKLTPGVRTSLMENESTTSRDASYNVNGLRVSWNNFILDGLDNNSYGVDNQGFSNQAIQPVLDAVNEFRVTTDNYGAEYGRVGGAVINASTKSGTAHFHGDIWDYIRNPTANAVGPFPLTPGSVPGPNQNQFGGVFGGPLPLHAITRTGKTFFFVDYEGLRRVQHAPLTATIPTTNQLNSLLNGAPFLDSSGRPIPIENPYTKTIYTTGVIPSPTAIGNNLAQIVLSNFMNLQNVLGQTVVAATNLTSNPAATESSNKGDGRFDWAIDGKQTFFVRYSSRAENVLDPSAIPGPNFGKSNGNTYNANQQIAAGYTRVLSSLSALDARLGFTWSQANRKPFDLGSNNILVAAGIPNAPVDPTIAGGLNTQAVTGFSPTWGRSASTPTTVNPFAINPKVNYSLLHGKHSIQIGYEYQHISTIISNTHPQFGTDTYKGLFTEGTMKALTLPGSTTADPAYKQAWALADFAFGARSEYELSNNTLVTDNTRYHAAYFQDDWRVLPNLTLNLGMRYEFTTPVWETNNELSNFNPATQSLVQASPGSLYNRALVEPNRLNFAPRLGVAYGINSRTLIHAAYGIGYIQFNRVAGADELASNLPTSIDIPISQAPPDAKTGAEALCTGTTPLPAGDLGTCFVSTQQGYPNGMLSAPTQPFNLLLNTPTYVPAHTPTTYIQSFLVNVQREIAHNLTFTIGYVGNTGTHELLLADANQALPNNAAGTETLQSRRPFNTTYCCSDISEAFNEGHSNYNSLQMKLEKRYSQGLYLINAFTWSHSMDDASGHLEEADGDSEYVNIYNMPGDRGRASEDQPINETLALTYDLPYGKGRRFGAQAPYLLQLVAGGWQTSVINQYTSGLPINLTYVPTTTQDVDVSLLSSYYRASQSGNPVLPLSAQTKTSTYRLYLNSATVSAPTANNMPFGDASRNSARGPNYNTFDLSVHKRFPLWSEASALELRVDAFNVLNHVNYQAPDGVVTDSTFGEITTAYPARELQGALKLFF